MGTQRAEYLVIRVKFDEPISDLALLRDMGFSQEVGRWRLAMEWRMGKRRDVNEWDSLKAGFVIALRPLIFRVSSPAGKQ